MNNLSKRPKSLYEISNRVNEGQQNFQPAAREFLDMFYSCPSKRQEFIEKCPEKTDDIKDAYLSAMGEHLARSYKLNIPEWTDTFGHALRKPFFAGGLESLKSILFVESPTAFRRRMIFISFNALDRPLKYVQEENERMEQAA